MGQMKRQHWLNAALRSIVWLGGAAAYAYLKKPDRGGLLSVRTDAIGWLGAGLVAAGLALHLWSNLALARGESEPAQAPTSLVVAGPYRYTRNPVYVAGIALLLGIGFWYSPWRVADVVAPAVLLAFFHLRVVRWEEPALRERFGRSYENYSRRVPRWLPRLRASRWGAQQDDAADGALRRS